MQMLFSDNIETSALRLSDKRILIRSQISRITSPRNLAFDAGSHQENPRMYADEDLIFF